MPATDPLGTSEASPGLASRPVRYPDQYLWYILAASLDLMLTNALINFHGFEEANALAARVIELGGFAGLITFKFVSVALVVVICEYVGGHRPITGRRLAAAAIAISGVPVVLGLLQLVLF